jgi:flagellar motor switch protein FliG
VAYRVNESVIAVWSLFEDKTVDEVVEEVSKELQIDPEEIRQAIADLAEQLIQAELLA